MSCIDVWTFRLAESADEDAFLQADRQVQERYMLRQPGFLRRTTARGDAGEWAVLLLWRSHDDAVAAQNAMGNDPVVAAFTSLLDTPSIRGRRYETLN
jgi:heme-degrading monooxygenase HmoA